MRSIRDCAATLADQHCPNARSFEVEKRATLQINLQCTVDVKASTMMA